jgi:hypothetical protein
VQPVLHGRKNIHEQYCHTIIYDDDTNFSREVDDKGERFTDVPLFAEKHKLSRIFRVLELDGPQFIHDALILKVAELGIFLITEAVQLIILQKVFQLSSCLNFGKQSLFTLKTIVKLLDIFRKNTFSNLKHHQ